MENTIIAGDFNFTIQYNHNIILLFLSVFEHN